MKGNKKKRSRKQEERIASELGGHVQPNSGALPGRKGDVAYTKAGFRVEAKYTDKSQFVLTRRVLDKIEREALRGGENYLIQVDINGKRVAVLDYQVLLLLLETQANGEE